MPYMYILKCADDSFYTGSTWNLEKRLWQHQNGMGANHTRKHLPVELVYCEQYERIVDAYRREKQIQGWSRRKKQALIEGNRKDLIEFSKNYTQYGRPASTSTGSVYGSAASTSSASEEIPSPELVEGDPPESEPLPELVEGNSTNSKIRRNLEVLGYGE